MDATQKAGMYQRIQQHGEDLNKIFHTGIEPVALCKKLRRLEQKAHRLTVDYCNGANNVTSDNSDVKALPILTAVDALLQFNAQAIPVFINYDARGYALKISDTWMREHHVPLHTDMGGYGILAPDFTPED